METFFDKLSQKLTAQEIITANTVAETAEVEGLRAQVAEYQDCLDQMRLVSERLSAVTQNLALQESKTQDLLARNNQEDALVREQMNDLVKEAAGRIRELETAKDAADAQILDALARMEGQLENAKSGEEIVSGVGESVEEAIHKECVKVYRNMQAVVQDELAKSTQTITETMRASSENRDLTLKRIKTRCTIALVMSILAFFASSAGVALLLFLMLAL